MRQWAEAFGEVLKALYQWMMRIAEKNTWRVFWQVPAGVETNHFSLFF